MCVDCFITIYVIFPKIKNKKKLKKLLNITLINIVLYVLFNCMCIRGFSVQISKYLTVWVTYTNLDTYLYYQIISEHRRKVPCKGMGLE